MKEFFFYVVKQSFSLLLPIIGAAFILAVIYVFIWYPLSEYDRPLTTDELKKVASEANACEREQLSKYFSCENCVPLSKSMVDDISTMCLKKESVKKTFEAQKESVKKTFEAQKESVKKTFSVK